MKERDRNKLTRAEVTLSNPRIVKIWDSVWFGSYPQAEVVPSGKYTALDRSLLQDGDIIVSDSIYNALQNAAGWDDNNEIILDGTKYRRMQKGDAACPDSYSYSCCYYQWSDSTTYHYFRYEPIKWRVLHTDGNQALLLADAALDNQQYINVECGEDVTWETSTIRSWLNGYGAGSNRPSVDFSQKNFIDSAFTALERAAIIDSTVVAVVEDRKEWERGTIDKIFLLSVSELCTKSFGFVTAEAWRSKSSTYAKAMGIVREMGSYYWNLYSPSSDFDKNMATYIGNCCCWWLRDSGEYYGLFVDQIGGVHDYGDMCFLDHAGVRAALNLNLSFSNLYTYTGTIDSMEM